jgi:hypothetical protein
MALPVDARRAADRDTGEPAVRTFRPRSTESAMSLHTNPTNPASVQERTQRLIQGAIRRLLSEAREARLHSAAATEFAGARATFAPPAGGAGE